MSTPAQLPVVLVTGAARGIGAACVAALAATGHRIVAVDACLGADHELPGIAYPLATRDQLESTVAPLGADALAVVADVRDRNAMIDAARAGADRFGSIDMVVASAAVISGGRPLWQTPEPELQTLWDVDVLGVINAAVATVPHLLAARDPARSRFIAIASAAASHGLFHLGGYTAAKHAVAGIVRALAQDLVGTGVVAVGISPGSTRTDMLDATAAIYGVGTDQLVQSQLLRSGLAPSEIAELVAYCCSPAGRVLNGTVVEAGGGFTG